MTDSVPMKQPDAHTVFLVSGGAKGITSMCVKKLASVFHSKFILLGRSPNVPEPDWANGANDDLALKRSALNYLKGSGENATPKRVQQLVGEVTSAREIRSTVKDVQDAGGTAHYIAVDITDRAVLMDAVKKAETQFGKITGCIHGAGVLADKFIQQKTVGDIDRVIGVKLRGLMNMLDIAPAEGLDYLVLFSSVAGFYGNAGQSDYAAANEILNKVAYQVHYRHPHCRVIALDWGPWDGGMVTPALKAMLAEKNIAIIPIETGTDILIDALTTDSPAPQWVVGQEMTSAQAAFTEPLQHYRIRRALSLEHNPFLRDHVIGGNAVLPTVCAVALVVNLCEQLYPGYNFYAVDDYRALKGIVFDATLADGYVLTLQEIQKSDL
ncbi:MAG: SDR family NAD(P)-dependent oxidoreductase, partial [Anaerolineales bacterium]